VVRTLLEVRRASVPERKILDELEAQLVECVACATAAWPGLIVAEQVFVCAITDRLHGDSPARALDAMQTNDLYLACGCAAGDRAALTS
jgi:RNA polymerase sigma-70 factor, ECF subfamily